MIAFSIRCLQFPGSLSPLSSLPSFYISNLLLTLDASKQLLHTNQAVGASLGGVPFDVRLEDEGGGAGRVNGV